MSEGVAILVAFVLGFALAQLIKCIIRLAKAEEISWARVKMTLMASGGMPSGHTASLAAVATFLGLAQGISTEFAIVCCLLAIVGYDAMNVRYAVGEQGKMLNKLMRRRMKIVEGHKPLEVLVGLVLGAAVGAMVFVAWRLTNGGF